MAKMKCNCCDRDLSDTEIVFNPDIGTFELCATCLNVALEAAYSQGFSPDGEPPDDPEMAAEFGNGVVETIDPDFQRDDYGDAGDIHYFGGFDDE